MERLFRSAEGREFAAQILIGPSRSIPLAAALGTVYFLVARLGQGLTLQEGVSVFWPAAALSSGVLIALGPAARLPVAAATILATVAVHLIEAAPLWASAALGLCNAAEALLVASLVDRHLDAPFSLGRLRHVLSLLVAAIVGTAVSGIGGVLIYRLSQGPSAPLLTTWQHWFASNFVGIMVGRNPPNSSKASSCWRCSS
jgi:integral membrane sensor domain MASE1